MPTDAGRAFAEHATASLRAVEDAADSVGELTALRTGTVAVGIFGGPAARNMDELAARFLRRHPDVSLRLIGRNSSAIADSVRRGELEAGVVLLPIDDDRLDVRPIVRDEVLYVSADPDHTRRPATIKRLATTPLVFYDAESADRDPIRRQLAERAQALGVRLQPKVEVELKDIALRLVAAGIGDTYLPSAYTHAAYYPAGLSTARSTRRSTTRRDHHAPRSAPLARRARRARGHRDAHGRDRRPVRQSALIKSRGTRRVTGKLRLRAVPNVAMPEFPPPIRLPGQPPLPREPYAPQDRPVPPTVVDEDADVYGAEDAAARLAERLRALESAPVHAEPGERPRLSPPLTVDRDRIEGPAARTTVVVFGAHGTPASRSLGAVLDAIRDRHLATVGIAWRHYPDPDAHPRAAILALAVEAAAVSARFWPLTRDLLHMRHHDPADLHAALVRSWLDPSETLDAMRAGVGADRIAADVSSAQASGVVVAPTLFIDGERFTGEVEPAPVLAALDAVLRARGAG